MTRIALIAAASENGVIGKDGDIPWRVKGDWNFFKRTSIGKPNIMGRKTFESLPEPLKDRTNVVITRNPDWRADGVVVFRDFDAALAEAQKIAARDGADEVIIAGGEEVYRTALPLAQRVYLTTIHCKIEDGDAFFPAFDKTGWIKASEEKFQAKPGDTADYTITVWDRQS